MLHIIYAVVLAFGVMLVAFSGKLVTLVFGEEKVSRNLSLFVSASAGVFIVFVVHALQEAFETISISYGVIAVVAGYLLAQLIQYFAPETHHHHGEECAHEGKRTVNSILWADGFHNMADGIALAVAAAISWQVGVIAWISIVIHETIQETGEYFALRHAGLTSSQALKRNFISASMILIGVAVGIFVDHIAPSFTGILVAAAAGMFLSVIAHDLIPATVKSTPVWKHLAACVIGIAVMMGILAIVPHEEVGHEDEIAIVR